MHEVASYEKLARSDEACLIYVYINVCVCVCVCVCVYVFVYLKCVELFAE